MPMLASEQKTKKLKRAKLRHAEYYDMQNVFDELYRKSDNNEVFTSLMPLICCRENILLAYRNIKKNKGSNTAGVDNRTIESLAGMNEDKFVLLIQKQLNWYKPRPVRRVEIPKPNGKKRPLGIPVIIDRIIQQCILQVLEPICEAKFYCHSYGFRPMRSTENAIARCHNLINLSHMHYVVDIDIKGFFDNVCHQKLIKQIWSIGIRDKKLLCIIKEMLKAPILMKNGDLINPTKGTPQGGILSPLLSNIVLNELDWWIVSQWEDMKTKRTYKFSFDKSGQPIKSNFYDSLRNYSNLKEVYIVRYADDFKLFCPSFENAQKMFYATKQWLKDRLNLEISNEKSKVVNLKKTYSDFLGFRLKARMKGEKWVVYSHVCEKAKDNIKVQLTERIKKIQRPANGREHYAAIQQYNAVVMGIHNYYCLATAVSKDFNDITYPIRKMIRDRLKSQHPQKRGNATNKAISERYGESGQIRYINGYPLVPAGYVQHKPPKSKRKKINPYTPDGREIIHKNLSVNMEILLWLMKNPVLNRTVEYADNRISLYAAQYGRCAITGQELIPTDIHCHHKIPVCYGGNDKYSNLIIVSKIIHYLIHVTITEKSKHILNSLNLSEKELIKLNKLREQAKMEAFII